MKKLIFVLFFIPTINIYSQYIDFEENPNYTVSHYGSRNRFYFHLPNINVLQKTRVVLYFRNTRSYLYRIENVKAQNVDAKIHRFVSCQFPQTPIDGYGRDSIVFNIEPLNEADYHELEYTIKRKTLDKTTNTDDNISIELKFSVVSPTMEDAQIGFPNPTKHYDIGKVYRILPMTEVLLKFYQKGQDPLLANLFHEKQKATRDALRGVLLQKGETSHFQYNYPIDNLGAFKDTLFVFTNGIDSLHQITISGELLEVEGNQPKFAHSFEKNTIFCDTIGTDTLKDSYEKKLEFKNIGKAPLIIRSVRGNGSIVCSWPLEPILPNETGTINMGIFTKSRKGPFSKAIVIETNEPWGRHIIQVKGYFYSEKNKE